MVIHISKDVARRLAEVAEEQGSSVNDLLNTLLDQHFPKSSAISLADLARNAQEAGLASSQPVNTADDSRTILTTEYADYLKRRMEESTRDDHNG